MLPKVCVIGAGPSGLCAIKHSIASNFEVVSFDKQNAIGGLWNYTDEIGSEVHSSMYKSLMITIPKEIMHFPGFPYPYEDHSFIPSAKFLNYLNLYADHFNLRRHIKLGHEVVRVRPLPDEKWEVIVRKIEDNKLEIFKFDYLFVCNGISQPLYPKIFNRSKFLGKQVHSHDYRKPEMFVGEKLLLIGSGPSAIEMALEIGNYAKKLFWSNNIERTHGKKINMKLPKSVEERPSVGSLTKNGVIFTDGSSEEITMIAYATGYDTKFPFLSVDCGISVANKHIKHLYKHIINIDRPTMAFIAIPTFSVGMQMFDLQIRFALKLWMDRKKFPSQEEMYQDTLNDENSRREQNMQERKFHHLGASRHKAYYEELAMTAEIPGVPNGVSDAFDSTHKLFFENFNIYRNYKLTFLNADEFRWEYQEKRSDKTIKDKIISGLCDEKPFHNGLIR